MTPIRILVTGSRDFVDRTAVDAVLHQVWLDLGSPADAVLVHGAARGADETAADVWKAQGFPAEPHPAEWEIHRRAAGPIRNQEMVDLGADVCVAFHQKGAGNVGTSDCVLRARHAGIEVRKVWSR